MPHMRAYKAKYGKMLLSANIDRTQAIIDAMNRLKTLKLIK